MYALIDIAIKVSVWMSTTLSDLNYVMLVVIEIPKYIHENTTIEVHFQLRISWVELRRGELVLWQAASVASLAKSVAIGSF